MPTNCLPEKVIGDKQRLEQILANLFKYALNCARGELIKVLASYNYFDSMLIGNVVHCGRGLSESALNRLKEFLNQEGDGSQEDPDLLGLVLCKKIVEKYEGKLTVSSDGPRFGTTITFNMRMIVTDYGSKKKKNSDKQDSDKHDSHSGGSEENKSPKSNGNIPLQKGPRQPL